MRHYQKIILFFISALLGSCFKQGQSSTSKTSSSSTSIKSLDYGDFKDCFLFYSNIFSVDKEKYYVYFFSKTCGHCNNLKSFVLSKVIDKDIYLVESSEEVIFKEDVSSTIGLTSIEGFGILGYPSLIEIKEKIITKNIGGISLIRSELTN